MSRPAHRDSIRPAGQSDGARQAWVRSPPGSRDSPQVAESAAQSTEVLSCGSSSEQVTSLLPEQAARTPWLPLQKAIASASPRKRTQVSTRSQLRAAATHAVKASASWGPAPSQSSTHAPGSDSRGGSCGWAQLERFTHALPSASTQRDADGASAGRGDPPLRHAMATTAVAQASKGPVRTRPSLAALFATSAAALSYAMARRSVSRDVTSSREPDFDASSRAWRR